MTHPGCTCELGGAHSKECYESYIKPRDDAVEAWRRGVKAAERAVINAAVRWANKAYGSDVEEAHTLERATNTLTDLRGNKPV
jgi:hypothetical protein